MTRRERAEQLTARLLVHIGHALTVEIVALVEAELEEAEQRALREALALKRNTPCATCGHRFDRHITEPDIEINYLSCVDCEACDGFTVARASTPAEQEG